MAKKVKITKGGQTVYPATVMDAVVHPDLRVDASKLIEEVNVSKIYPTGGIDGTNKYTLETAIAMIPASLRNVGIKCSFLDDAGDTENWEYLGGTFTNTASWREYGGRELTRLENAIGEKVSYSIIQPNVRFIPNLFMQEDGNVRAGGCSIACFPVYGDGFVKCSNQLYRGAVSNIVNYTIFNANGTFTTGKYDTSLEEVTIELPANSVSIAISVLQAADTYQFDFKVFYKNSKSDLENTFVSSMSKNIKSNRAINGYYDRNTHSFVSAYNNLMTVYAEVAENEKYVSFPIFQNELQYSTVKVVASNITFFQNDTVISSMFYAYGEDRVITLPIPEGCTRIAATYYRDEWCESNGYKKMDELGGVQLFLESSYKEINNRILQAEAILELSDLPNNLIDNYYSPKLINPKYVNTDAAKIKYDSAYFDYPCLVSNNQSISTNLTVKFNELIPNLDSSNIGLIACEIYASLDKTVQFSVMYTDSSYKNYNVNLVQGYNGVLLYTDDVKKAEKTIKQVVIYTTSVTDEIGKVYIGKDEPIQNFYGSNDFKDKKIKDLSPMIEKNIQENKPFSNLTSLSEIALVNGLDNLDNINQQYLRVNPTRFDNDTYALIVKTTGAKSQWIVSDFYDNLGVEITPDTLQQDKNSSAASKVYKEIQAIDVDNYSTLCVQLFKIKESFLGRIRIVNQTFSSTALSNIIDIQLIAVPSYFTRPSDVAEFVSADKQIGYVANSMKSLYAASTGSLIGKNMTGLGDSIMSQATYLPTILRKTGMYLLSNISAGGAHVRPNGDNNCIFFFADNVPEESDFILIIASQNDSGRIGNAEYMGTISDEPYLGSENRDGVCTFASAYKGMLVKLIQKCPTAKIVCCGLLPTWTLTAAGMEAFTKNKLILNDFVRDICELYGVQFVDLIRNVGINWYNAPLMFNHDGSGEDGGPVSDLDGQVHPSSLGGEMCGKYIVSQII